MFLLLRKVLKFLKDLSIKFVEILKLINPYLYFFYYKNLKFSKNIKERIGFNYPLIDKQIIYRKPKLNFKNQLISLDTELYSEEGELRSDILPYTEYFEVLEKTFDLKKINNFF